VLFILYTTLLVSSAVGSKENKELSMVVATAKLTSEYQITLPADVRRRLRLQAGDVVYLTLEGDRVILRGLQGGWTEAYHGLGAELWRSEGGGAAIEAERDSWD
jgi:AbrB family looped-hinge helix DNA binding protein